MVLFPLALVLTAFEPSLLHVSPLQGTTGDPASLHVIDGFTARRNGRPTADDSNLFPANGHGVATLFTFMAATFSRLRPAEYPESCRRGPPRPVRPRGD